jgi:hypothetical protein
LLLANVDYSNNICNREKKRRKIFILEEWHPKHDRVEDHDCLKKKMNYSFSLMIWCTLVSALNGRWSYWCLTLNSGKTDIKNCTCLSTNINYQWILSIVTEKLSIYGQYSTTLSTAVIWWYTRND